MSNRSLPVLIATGVLFGIALVGYLIPARSEGVPTRTLLENKAGPVILTHASHVQAESGDCSSCHHTSGNDATPPACSQCHVKKFDDAFIEAHQKEMDKTQCANCHHPSASIDNFTHDKHAEDYAEEDCQTCHHDESIEPEPQACSDCHDSEDSDDMPSLKRASHSRCADCHSDFYEEGIKGCSRCHIREHPNDLPVETRPCSSCHSLPTDQLVPTTTNAFHGQCMGCHEKQNSGPFGDDACYQCHMK